jgi:hypothetical protein
VSILTLTAAEADTLRRLIQASELRALHPSDRKRLQSLQKKLLAVVPEPAPERPTRQPSWLAGACTRRSR